MKTIVLATDFSPMANQAAMFANQLAHDQKAGLILLHVYQGWATDPARTEDAFRSEKAVSIRGGEMNPTTQERLFRVTLKLTTTQLKVSAEI